MRIIITAIAVFISTLTYAQVGIGTTTPHASAILDLTAPDKALLLPRVADTAAIAAPTDGMMIYDLSSNCIKSYENGAWTACLSQTAPTPSVVANCNLNSFEGSYTNGTAMTAANQFSVTITNNSFTTATISFQTSDLVLSGVPGITVSAVSIPSVTLNAGQSQQVAYALSGTPTADGTLTGTWTKLALSCTKTVAVINPAIASLDCAGATHNGTLTGYNAASGVSSDIAYTGGDGSAYSGQTVTSTGVTGLTATLAAGNFATGAGALTYTITGTPTSVGTASFAINIGGISCTLTRTVASPVPATLLLAQTQAYTVTSIYDQDYLPYTALSAPATMGAQAADGSNEAVIVNVQGTITTAGTSVNIPVTATGSDTLLPYTQTITIPAGMTEDGISRDLTLSWTAQPYTAATTSINATIASVGGTFNAPKLDMNAGVGNDALGVLIAQFTYPFNNTGTTTTYNIRDIAGIPDRMFGIADNAGSNTSHNMVYVPKIAEDGKIWLNNNLGAHYANINHASFNPAQQATTRNDYLAYGSLFQWGRRPDGHELITYTSSTTGIVVNGPSSATNMDIPTDAVFIKSSSTPLDWRVNQDDMLWATEASTNNPCPVGFRVPTLTELIALANAADIYNGANSTLQFSYPGHRYNSSGWFNVVGVTGRYWSSTVSSIYGRNFLFVGGTGSGGSNSARAYGFSVRCIKD